MQEKATMEGPWSLAVAALALALALTLMTAPAQSTIRAVESVVIKTESIL